MKKVFISQGMRGKTEDEIQRERKDLENLAHSAINEEIQIIDSLITEEPPKNINQSLWYLGESLKIMACADVVIFAKDWEKYRGCRIEYQATTDYGIEKIIPIEGDKIDDFKQYTIERGNNSDNQKNFR